MKRIAGLAALAAAAACATAPDPRPALEQARASYQQALAHPEAQLRAPVELQLAGRSLEQAERLQRNGAEAHLVAHHAYLAAQRARIAMASADYRHAEALVADSGEQRNRVLLEARERELAGKKTQAGDIERLRSELTQLKAQPTERGWVLTLSGDVLFDSGEATLKPGGVKSIDSLAQVMRNRPEPAIAVEGFTDSTGSPEINRRLSEQRARAVKDALVARGIDARRIEARGYGPDYPVASNDTPVGRQLNRRVQVVIARSPE